MTTFTLYDADNAKDAAKPLLQNSIKAFGSIPNLHGVMAESPALLDGYQKLHGLAQQSSFNNEELTVVWQAINVEHACHYCVPAHSAIAKSMRVSDDINNALRDETPLPTEELNILRKTALEILRERGHLSDETKAEFFAAGFTNQHLLDIILVLSQKVMSNYVNHLAETPIDDAFMPFVWTPNK